MEPRSLVLDWGAPDNAEAFFTQLYALAFQKQDGMLYMPGQYPLEEPPLEIKAKLHMALAKTFYAHGPATRGSTLETKVVTIMIDEEPVTITYDVWSKFKHADSATDLLAKKTKNKEKGKRIADQIVTYKSAVSPGAFARHEAHKATIPSESVDRALCLHFAIVGCQSLLTAGSSGVLVIPEVKGLEHAGMTRSARWSPRTVSPPTTEGRPRETSPRFKSWSGRARSTVL
jgi:CRISPR-associated protein Cas8a1/Csx13